MKRFFASLLFGAMLIVPAAFAQQLPPADGGGAPSSAPHIYCSTPSGVFCYGTDNAEFMHSTNSGQTISSREGPDTLYGNGGDDWLQAGSGKDLVYGGPGDDNIWGGLSSDELRGGDGVDYINAGCNGGCSKSQVNEIGDYINGGGGPDTILAVNGKKDLIDCGNDSWTDTVYADIYDSININCDM